MCGIAGYIKKNKIENGVELLKKMGASIAHRGPDSEGVFLKDNVGFVHRRLSIIDLSEASNQPFYSKCKNYVLVFNGEIFNYKEIKADLEKSNIQFSTNSDTEVLLELLIRDGIGALKTLNGFFSFAFYNISQQEVYLARDRFGVKPLFYSKYEDTFVFASEPKAIFVSGLKKEIDSAHLDELFFYRSVSGENTIFKNIRRVLPGHWAHFSLHSFDLSFQRWFNLGEEAKKIVIQKEPYQWFEETFNDSIRMRMISDVPVGTLLSGGLDSSAVALSQFKQGYKQLSAWNISFSNYEHNESEIAKKWSDEIGFDFYTQEFKGDQLVELFKEALFFMDEPMMHLQEAHLLGISKLASQRVKVLLSGEGSDELLGGYVRYKMHDGNLRHKLLSLSRYLPKSMLKDMRWKKMQKYFYMNNEQAQIMMNANNIFLKDLEENHIWALNILPEYRVKMLEEAKQIYPNNALRQLMYYDQHTYIPTLNDRNDRTTMGASIECREPFLDHRIGIGVASLPDSFFSTNKKGKKILVNTFGIKLPTYILNHRKIGLSVPWHKYFLDIPFFKDHLLTMHNSPIFKMGNLDQIDVKGVVNDYLKGDSDLRNLIFSLFFISIWFDNYFEQ
jgi:asparagine synthase (glutamine-hydrolysing)